MRVWNIIMLCCLIVCAGCSPGNSPKRTTKRLSDAITNQALEDFLDCFYFTNERPESMSDSDYLDYLKKQPVVAGFIVDGFILGADDSVKIRIISEKPFEEDKREVKLCWVFLDGSESKIQTWYFINIDGTWKIHGDLTYRSIWGEPGEDVPKDKTEEPEIPEGTIVQYYKVDVKPKPINLPKHEYPQHVKKAGIEGNTVVQVLVDTNGTVLDTKIIKSSGNDALDKAAVVAAKKATFTHPQHKGKAVRVWVAIPMKFELE